MVGRLHAEAHKDVGKPNSNCSGGGDEGEDAGRVED
jgi:hypothetical protein